MKQAIASPVLLMVMTIATSGVAQEGGTEDSSRSVLVSAIEDLAKQDVSLTCSVAQESPNEDEDGLFGGIQMAVIQQMGGAGKPFAGDMDVLCTARGEVVAVSRAKLPSLKIYSDNGKRLYSQAHLGGPLDFARVGMQIPSLCSWKELAAAVENASRVRVSTDNGVTKMRVTLNSDFIPEAEADVPAVGGGAVKVVVKSSSIEASVIDLAVTFALNGKQQITDIECAVQYNDPMKAMLGKAMARGGAGGALQLELGPGKDGKADDVLGKLHMLKFSISETPSESAQAFAEEARGLLQEQ